MRKVKSREAGTWEWLRFERNHATSTDALFEGIILFVLHFTLFILIKMPVPVAARSKA